MKEKEIILAARKRFAYYGFSKVTMDEIAADIGMAKASLYYYFPTKVDLFIAVVTEEQDQFIERSIAYCKQKRLQQTNYSNMSVSGWAILRPSLIWPSSVFRPSRN